MLKLKLQYFGCLMQKVAFSSWKRLWCWEGLGAGGDGDNRGWDGWMASVTRWTWVWVNSGSWWWTGRPGMLRFMGSQRVGYDWATELNWTGLLMWLYLETEPLRRCWGQKALVPWNWCSYGKKERLQRPLSLCVTIEMRLLSTWCEGCCPPVNRRGLLRNGTWWHLDF